MEKKLKSRNPIARACAKVNKPKVVPAKKGRGSVYRRMKSSHHRFLENDA